MEDQYRHWMRQAIDVAQRGWGDTHPNPVVGALIIEGGEIVSEGYHARAGELHAERNAFKNLGRNPKPGSSMVVTMEPCSTYGRQPPCVNAVIEAGIKTLIVGVTDPNPSHAGRGFEILRSAGVEVVSGVETAACEDLNLIFNHHIQRPQEAFFAAKVATTLDGKIATRKGHSQWITGNMARTNVAKWRRYFPAILVGAGTIIADNPRLTSRLEGKPVHCPRRLIVDTKGELETHTDAHVFKDEYLGETIILTAKTFVESEDYLKAFRQVGGRVVEAPLLANSHRIDWSALKRWCAEESLPGVYLEPGQGLMASLLDQGALDYLFQYIAPKILGDYEAFAAFGGLSPVSMNEALCIESPIVETMGADVLVRGHLDMDVQDRLSIESH